MVTRREVLVGFACLAMVLGAAIVFRIVFRTTSPARIVRSESPAVASSAPPTAAATPPEELLRIYDFDPISESNPVVASIQGTPIVIPLSEFRAYLKAEVSEDDRKNLDPASKRKHLERLVDELLLLREAYRQNVDRSESVARTLESTRRALLAEFVTREEVGEKATSADDYAAREAALEDRLFEKAEVVVSNEGYAAFKEAVIQHGTNGSEKLPTDRASHLLATCGDMKLAVGDAFAMYVGLAPAKRPDIANPAGLSALLKKLLADGLKVAHARERGIDTTRSYRETVAANRASLTRMWVQDRFTNKAARHMKERDAGKASLQNDDFDLLRQRLRAERAAQLREGRTIDIDERILSGA